MKMPCLPLKWLTFRQGLHKAFVSGASRPSSTKSSLLLYYSMYGWAGGTACANIITKISRIDKSPNAFIGTELWVRKPCFKIEYSSIGNRRTDDENVIGLS